MIDLSTEYLGLKLKNPIVPSASPLSRDVDTVKHLEDCGASAIVLYSLFEEQIDHEKHELDHFLTHGTESYAEALDYFPEPEEYTNLEAEDYLEHIHKLKECVDIPVIASLNGVSEGGWMKYAKRMQEAGADAIELNIYYVAADPAKTSQDIEQIYIDDLLAVKRAVSIPVAMKLSPYFTAFANMAGRLDRAGVDGLVLFNRFYQPDINLEELTVEPHLVLSSSWEGRLPLRWMAILKDHVNCSLATTSGVHNHEDILKMIMVGADVAMTTSALLKHGVQYLKTMLEGLESWMVEKEYESINQMKGSMSNKRIQEPEAYERANYMKTLLSYRS